MSDAELPMRQAARALMIDHRDRVLLVKLNLRGWIGWVLPGGGIEDGEDVPAALRRELHEETGLVDAFIGPVVCIRRQTGSRIAPGYRGQHETIHLVPCHDFVLAPALSENELRAEGVMDARWFTLEELRSTTDTIVPGRLPALIDQVLEYGGSVDPMIIDVSESP